MKEKKLTLGQRVEEFRKLKGISRDQLAKDSGITTVGLWKIETDRSQPLVNTLKSIAEALDVPVATFLS